MGSLSMSFGDGEWHHVAGPIVDGESPIEEAQRIAYLREAQERQANRVCETCGRRGVLSHGGDRYHGPGLCDQPGGAA